MKYGQDIFIGGVLLAIVGVVAGVSYHSLTYNPLPKFLAGTCIQYWNSEPWEDTYKIEMVGKNNYLVRYVPESLYKTSKGWSLPFDHQPSLIEVKCPERK